MIQKEKHDLLCKAVKFSTKLMAKLMSALENYETMNSSIMDLLTKIKIFLKITRLVVQNAKEEIQRASGKEQEFFTMYIRLLINRILVFTEKIQAKLYSSSNKIISTSMGVREKIASNSNSCKYGIGIEIENNSKNNEDVVPTKN